MCRLISLGWFMAFALAALALPKASHAEMLRVSFSDPVCDHAGQIDIVGFEFTFNNTTGDYRVRFRADSGDPFAGLFEMDVSLFNPDAGSSTADTSFFQASAVRAANMEFPITSGFSGNSPVLLSWNLGDRVAANQVPFGVPDDLGETEFRTMLLTSLLPIGEGPGFDPDIGDQIGSGNVVAVIVPESSGFATIVIGGVLLGLFFFGRRHRVNAGMARRVGLPICLYLNKTFHASTIKSEEYSCVA